MVSIDVRPEVNDRLMLVSLGGRPLQGLGHPFSVGVLVERSTRLALLCKMLDAKTESALAAFTTKLHLIAQPLRETFDCDRGKEMTHHRVQATNMRVYFCDPHSPWRRGRCEKTNGLLRRFLSKRTDLNVHDQDALNSMPI